MPLSIKMIGLVKVSTFYSLKIYQKIKICEFPYSFNINAECQSMNAINQCLNARSSHLKCIFLSFFLFCFVSCVSEKPSTKRRLISFYLLFRPSSAHSINYLRLIYATISLAKNIKVVVVCNWDEQKSQYDEYRYFFTY